MSQHSFSNYLLLQRVNDGEMKEKLRKHKTYYVRICRLGKACDVSFDLALQMIKLRADVKRLTRKKTVKPSKYAYL